MYSHRHLRCWHRVHSLGFRLSPRRVGRADPDTDKVYITPVDDALKFNANLQTAAISPEAHLDRLLLLRLSGSRELSVLLELARTHSSEFESSSSALLFTRTNQSQRFCVASSEGHKPR
uniref:Uncharacterized protein n=1 Tax=Steinernema glaseri TaxID=37863 RepID=A0A1I7YLQ8_9BILA